jgi:hypothetical protein
MTPARRPSSVTRAAGLLATYLLAALALTWPLARHLTDRLGAPEGPGDPYLNLWILGLDLRTLTNRPLALLDGRIFDANIFHPATGTLTYSDHLLPQALLALPVYLITHDPVLCYNAVLVLSLVFSGIAMHVCARQLGASERGALLAGLAWTCWPYRISHLIHLQLQLLCFLPLAVLALHRLIARPSARRAIALGGLAGLQALCSIYYGVMTSVALPILALGVGWGTGRIRSARLWRHLVLAALIGTVVVAPGLWPYWRTQQREGFARNLYEASQHAAVPASYVQVSDDNWLYGRTRLLTARDASGRIRLWRLEGVEQALFPGLGLIVLAGVGVWRARRDAAWPTAMALLALAAVGIAISLGPDGIRPFYAACHRYIFGFQTVRAPARFAVLVQFALAVLAARGLTRLESRQGRRVATALLVMTVAEYGAAPLTLVPRPPLRTALGAWLLTAPGPGAVIYLPLTHDRRNTIGMVESLQHGRPIVNGYSGQRPAFYAALVDTMSVFPSADALLTLRDLDVRFVVSPLPIPEQVDASQTTRGVLPLSATPLVERVRLPEGIVYELVWSGALESRLVPSAPPAPPEPGPLPFAIGERATYDVRWVGGPLDLTAGRVTIAVAPPPPDAQYQFVVTAETASWVSQFFEARDQFVTDADADLWPLSHARAQQQGRGMVNRRYVYDTRAGTVTLSSPAAGRPVLLRMPPSTRDALTTFFYLRTLPLRSGDALTLSVNDGGRNRVLHFRVAARETVTIAGQTQPAIRLEPTITERVPRRAPVEAVAWMSDDSRRVVLAADVASGFGRVRLELVEYRAR